tara:strand:- start:744 stop:980 length:237 start_codon:yes stop_codon:yes gene_type:complete
MFKSDFFSKYYEKPINFNDFDIILIGYRPHNVSNLEYLIEKFLKLKIKYEIMESLSAYKTHNILTSENRKILTILEIL